MAYAYLVERVSGAFLGEREADRFDHLVRSGGGLHHTGEKFGSGKAARTAPAQMYRAVEGHQSQSDFRRRISMRDRAANRTPRPCLDVTDPRQGSGQQGHFRQEIPSI